MLQNILLNIHWIIVSIIILFNIYLGYRNGTKKTIYYVIVDIILTIAILFSLTFISVKTVYTPEMLLEKLETIFYISDDLKEYFLIPELSDFLFSLVDLVIRFVLFIGIYPLIKWILRVTVFRIIYNKTLEDNKVKPVEDRKLGALLGLFKGIVISLIFLSPVISVNKINRQIREKSDNKYNINHLVEDLNMPIKVRQYINKVTYNNTFITKVKMDNYIFEMSYEKKDVKLQNELNNLVEIYLVVKKDNTNKISELINITTNSKLLKPLINPIINYEVEKNIGKELNFNPNDKYDQDGNYIYSNELYELIKELNYKKELQLLNMIFENNIYIKDVNQFIDYIKDPLNLYKLNENEKKEFLTMIDSLTKLDLTIFSNLLLENIIRDEKIIDNFKWTNNEIKYLSDKLSFILNDYNYIKNNKEEVKDIFELFLKYNFKDFKIKDIDDEFINYIYNKVKTNKLYQTIIPLVIEYSLIEKYGYEIDKLLIDKFKDVKIEDLKDINIIKELFPNSNLDEKEINRLLNNNKFNELTSIFIKEIDLLNTYFNYYIDDITLTDNIVSFKNLYQLLLNKIDYEQLKNLPNMDAYEKSKYLIQIGKIKNIKQILNEFSKLDIINKINHNNLQENNELNKDIVFILDLAYTFFYPLYQVNQYRDIEEINILENLDINRLINLFTIHLKENNSALQYNLVKHLKTKTTNQQLINNNYNDTIWKKELENYVLGILFSIPEIINKNKIYSYTLIELFNLDKEEFKKHIMEIKKDNGLASTYLNNSIIFNEKELKSSFFK